MSDEEQSFPELDDTAMSVEAWEDEAEPQDDQYIDAHLPPIVDDLRPGETLEQRNDRQLADQERERQADRPEGMETDPFPEEILRRHGLYEEPATRTRIRASAVNVIDAEGNESWRNLGTDEDAVHTFVELQAAERGLTVQELRRPLRPGRPAKARPHDVYRRKVIAEIIQAAIAAGAQQTMLAKVLDVAPQRVSELAGAAS